MAMRQIMGANTPTRGNAVSNTTSFYFESGRSASCVFDVEGTFVGTLVVEARGVGSGGAFVAIPVTPIGGGAATTAGITAPGTYRTGDVSGLEVRFRVSAYTSGEIVVYADQVIQG